ncbi:hypothetical protein DY000_02047848 [Brassica cretica]|uniref:Aminotransferase-like plant mobile domain-containing protein n=1 Tax=Brassica cretica TaxID=69181 RepID=A0ABQ7EWU7_BRACR|nr:hypothetical protein DY000_02047848 [Brassica cretica]
MWNVWSLENDRVTRRLHEDPGIIGDGGTEALIGSLDRVWDPEVPVRPRDRGWNPEVSMIGLGGRMRIHGFSLRSGDRIGTLVYLDPVNRISPLRLCWNPKVWIRRSLVGTRRFFEVVMTPMRPRLHRGTVLRLPRQGYYRYLFGFRILPLGSWPLSSSYAVFYFCRKSLTGLEGAGVGVMTQVPGLRCFPHLEKQDIDCSLRATVVVPLFVRVGQDRRSLET